MIKYVRVEERQRMARQQAALMLAGGVAVFSLTLRTVAAEMGVPLSTLTYAYPSIEALLTDMWVEFIGDVNAAVVAGAGAGGLHRELRRAAKTIYCMGVASPVGRGLLRWQYARLPEETNPVVVSDASRDVVLVEYLTRVSAKRREEYRIPIPVLASLIRALADGAVVSYFTHGDNSRYYREMIAAGDAVTLAADPRPIGAVREDRPFRAPVYSKISVPPC